MSSPTTVIILAEPATEPAREGVHAMQPMASLSTLDTLLRRVLGSGMQVLLVAPPDQAHTALSLLPQKDILIAEPIGCEPALSSPMHSRADALARNLAAGVMARADASGWIVLPGDMPMLQGQTLHELARSISHGPIVYPCHRHVRGLPVAFSSELYSELIRLQAEADLRRLTARYPAAEVEVNDPGIHMALASHTGLDQLRAQLVGPQFAARQPQIFSPRA